MTENKHQSSSLLHYHCNKNQNAGSLAHPLISHGIMEIMERKKFVEVENKI